MQLAQKLAKVYGWTVKTDFVGKDEMDEESLNSVVTKRMRRRRKQNDGSKSS